MEDTIQQLADDFENERGPFSQDLFPEQRLVDALGDEYKAGYLSAFCTWDYNRGVDNLVSNVIQLSEMDDGYGTNHFAPTDVISVPLDELQAQFASIGFRYPNRDAKGWQDNCRIITNKFSGDWHTLYAAAQHSAPTLVRVLNKEDFLYLKGAKLAPFYCRVINDHVVQLDDLWALNIPVDTHIRRLSRELFNRPEMSDDEIRSEWEQIGRSYDLSPALVDGALWQIGYSWDDWGQQYWEDLTNE